MQIVSDLFRDEFQTEFIVATIPTMMAISESQRLVDELRKEHIPIRHLFVNMLQPSNEDCSFCSVRHKEHQSNLNYIKSQFPGMRIATVQSFDREIRGAPALRAMGSQLCPGGAHCCAVREGLSSGAIICPCVNDNCRQGGNCRVSGHGVSVDSISVYRERRHSIQVR
jgi:hypothetical protein